MANEFLMKMPCMFIKYLDQPFLTRSIIHHKVVTKLYVALFHGIVAFLNVDVCEREPSGDRLKEQIK